MKHNEEKLNKNPIELRNMLLFRCSFAGFHTHFLLKSLQVPFTIFLIYALVRFTL